VDSWLTDEQVVERLPSVADWVRYTSDPRLHEACELALALQERLQAADAERDRMSDSATVIIRRAEAAEAERDEARRALPTDQQRKTLAYWLWPEAPGSWDDLAAAAKRLRESHDVLVRDVATARQQARREAFEEAAKLRCYRCRQGVPVRLAPGGPSKLFWHDLPGGDVVVCESAAIRALAEVER
jgi:hypothetical protein